MEPMDRLENINRSDWPELRDMFQMYWPQHLLAYSIVQHYIEVKEKNPLYKVHIFCLNNDWSDGTFITFDGHHVQVYTLEESCKRLERAIDALPKCLALKICCTLERFVPAVKNSLKKVGMDKTTEIVVTDLYWIRKDDALKFDCSLPPNTYISPIDPKCSTYINSLWPHRFVLPKVNCEFCPHFGVQNAINPKEPKSSNDWIKDMIAASESVGLYNSDHGLMSWVMLLHNHGLCALQTGEKYLRKGYGAVVAKNMSKSLALEGKDTFGFIVHGNTASVNLFVKLGFQNMGSAHWFMCEHCDSPSDLQELKRLCDNL